jgi:RHS repeat-associated protein
LQIKLKSLSQIPQNRFSPFGVTLTNRNFNSADYRYGFQNQERDDEMKGEGNSVNFTYRMHDTRLGRFFAVDPLASQFSYNSPYAFSENKVIEAVEMEGLEVVYTKNIRSDGYTVITITADIQIRNSSSEVHTLSIQELKTYAKAAKKGIEEKFSLTDTENKIIYNTKVNLQYSKEVDPTDGYEEDAESFSIQFTRDPSTNVTGDIGNTQKNNFVVAVTKGSDPLNLKSLINLETSLVSRVAAHEFGHTVGLLHKEDEMYKVDELRPWYNQTIDYDASVNQMEYGSQTEVLPEQMKAVIATINFDKNAKVEASSKGIESVKKVIKK